MKTILVIFALCTSLNCYSSEKAPVVFIHGIIAWPGLYQGRPFSLKRTLARRGYRACVINNKPIGTIDESAAQAAHDIKKCVPSGPFHLVGHSQGGLASRMLAHNPEFKHRILSITTLSTPHHGSILADRFLVKIPEWGQEVFKTIFSSSMEMVKQLTKKHMTEVFNPRYPDQPGIRYFSFGHYIPAPIMVHASVPVLKVMHDWMVEKKEGPNDGFVGTYSTQWGEYLGDFPGDHIAETFPAPMAGSFIVYDVMDRVTENLNRNFP